MTDRIAFVRGVPNSFPQALVLGTQPHLDVSRARRQHIVYCEAIVTAGYTTETIPADDAHPDCPFIEDAAVALDRLAVITRPGSAIRRGETEPVAAALARRFALRTIEGPGTVDGGDVLRIGERVFIGRSSRTNDAGIAQFARFAAEEGLETTPVDVSGVLHLKSAVSYLGNDTVLVAAGCVDVEIFGDYRTIEKDPGETHLASTLRLDEGRLLVTDTAPQTSARISRAGFEVVPIDMAEFQAADGGLTCLSILVPAPR